MQRLKQMLLSERSFFSHPDPSNLFEASEWQAWSQLIDGQALPWNDPTWQLVRQYKLYGGEDDIILQRSLFNQVYSIFTSAEQYGAAALGIHPHGCHVDKDVMAVYHRAVGIKHDEPVSAKVSVGLQLEFSPSQWVEYMDATREHVTYEFGPNML